MKWMCFTGVIYVSEPLYTKQALVYSPHFFLHLSILPPLFPSPKYTPPIFLLLEVSSPHSSSRFIYPPPTVESKCMWPPPISKIVTPEFDASNTPFLWISTYLPPIFWNKYLPPPILELFWWNVMPPPKFSWNRMFEDYPRFWDFFYYSLYRTTT